MYCYCTGLLGIWIAASLACHTAVERAAAAISEMAAPLSEPHYTGDKGACLFQERFQTYCRAILLFPSLVTSNGQSEFKEVAAMSCILICRRRCQARLKPILLCKGHAVHKDNLLCRLECQFQTRLVCLLSHHCGGHGQWRCT